MKPAMSALRSMMSKKYETSDLVFHQGDGSPWKSILESFHSLLKKCGETGCIHALRHTFGAHLAPGALSKSVPACIGNCLNQSSTQNSTRAYEKRIWRLKPRKVPSHDRDTLSPFAGLLSHFEA